MGRGYRPLVCEASPNLEDGYNDVSIPRKANNESWRAPDEVADPSRVGWEGGNYDEDVNAATVAGNPENARLAIATAHLPMDERGHATRVGVDALPNEVHKKALYGQPARKMERTPDAGDRRYAGRKANDVGDIDPRYWNEEL